MQMESIAIDLLHTFITSYRNKHQELFRFFDYQPYEENVFHERMQDMKEYTYPRENLSKVLNDLNKRWKASDETFSNIERLKADESMVVIGGQQAGLLTGPLYTIHKIVSIIQLAQKQEKELNKPVLPVFWIAGEDHDFDEINHIYLPSENELVKHPFNDGATDRSSVSHRKVDRDQLKQWVKEVTKQLDETTYTKDLFYTMNRCVDESETLVDFFATFVHHLFAESGLILVDSADPQVRGLEAEFFTKMIQTHGTWHPGVYQSLQSLRQLGYPISVDVDEDDGHLFYHLDNERILLKREGALWIGKNNECRLTEEELLHIASDHPERLSNNVVTRPIMQDLLFPTLAFLGGPSEVGYWSILKPTFQAFERKMPPVLPRVSITLVEEKVNKRLATYDIPVDSSIQYGTIDQKQNWLRSQLSPPIHTLETQLKQTITKAHEPLQDVANSMSDDVKHYAKKNLEFILEDVETLTQRLRKEVENENTHHIQVFDYVNLHLHPENGLQERIWNVLYFMNQYGTDWIHQLYQYDFDYQQPHYIAYLP
ncbi:hypothetical protein J416_01324 [Gracilibacillus halophilus YIM-C55.5]|uniref:Putative cysteine ligase BshC n=1 Tax=Gracilibacillus halophilus YIM-C55.5 TaxID=1308866 RepID=N4WDI7_9BACI|nr:bacillithiol biosynthesis cysteine-adding enzyme BshC [Gracilibacillus halophilus]ENH98338.1 hypothetical protein J416_01324 [Gracilibacillus halophilus YIM-C55.5]